MGLSRQMVDAIVREHTYSPIAGDVLLIGRQTVYLSPREALEIVADHGMSAGNIKVADIEIDHNTVRRREGGETISDAALFKLLGNDRVRALDHTDYEGAEVFHDLSNPLPNSLKEIADFVIDGSTLDNCFNPALTIKTYAELLRPGGRLLAIDTYSNFFDPYVIVTPLWFFDYFVINGFSDCQVYVLVSLPGGATNTFSINRGLLFNTEPDPTEAVRNFVSPYEMAMIVIAEKAKNSTSDKWPTQHQYRTKQQWVDYRHNLNRILASPRPPVVKSYGELSYFDVQGGWLFVTSDYVERYPLDEAKRLRMSRNEH
jgi:SAM-dependent methyltransferase